MLAAMYHQWPFVHVRTHVSCGDTALQPERRIYRSIDDLDLHTVARKHHACHDASHPGTDDQRLLAGLELVARHKCFRKRHGAMDLIAYADVMQTARQVKEVRSDLVGQ
ncbi:hypothetical protein SN15_04580 [Stenotrophomonas maltophilia]|nr:hypothetical protein SN15_04580 [Stenotrophomonas maltophilia]